MNNLPLSLRVLKLILLILKWGSLIAYTIASIIIIRSFFDPTEIDKEVSYTGYASDIDTSALSVRAEDGRVGTVEFYNNPWVKINFPPDPNETAWSLITQRLVFFALLGVALWFFQILLKQMFCILETVKSGTPFVSENAMRARKIGLILLFGTLAQSVFSFAISGYVDANFSPTGFNFNGHVGINFIALLSSLSALAIAEVFRYGIKLREEQELTV